MEFVTAKQASAEWGVTPRRVAELCAGGRIAGAVKASGVWLLPPAARKPADARVRCGGSAGAGGAGQAGQHQTLSEDPELEVAVRPEAGPGKAGESAGPRLVSLFSGCGGLDLGFEQAGFRRTWANDFDRYAAAVYERNLGRIDGRDITEVECGEIPDCDIITAGFPCQPFSSAGDRKGVHDSRGMLYKECLRIIEAKMPKAIVFENVKGLLSTKHVDGRDLADVIIDDLSQSNGVGYNVQYALLNASDFGVPQNRQRVFFIGIRNDLHKRFRFPEKQPDGDLRLETVLRVPKSAPNQVSWDFSPQAQKMVERIPEGGSWKDVPYEHLAPRFRRIRDDMKKHHSPNFYRRFSRDEICGTITASAQPENCGIIHPTEDRRYTIREVARIQTFPDDFVFMDGSLREVTAMYRVIGNAVPVRLAKAIAQEIMAQVFNGTGAGANGHGYGISA